MLSFSICLSFSPSLSVSVSHPRFLSLFLLTVLLLHSHTNTDGCWVPLQGLTKHTDMGEDWTKRLSLHIQVCGVCIALTGTGMAGLVSVYVTVDMIPNEMSVCVCVSACVCLCISFYLGIASEQFTACHSLSGLGTKRKRERKMDWREKKKARKRKKRERLTIGRKRRAVRSSGGGGKWGEQEKERKGG